MYLSLQASFYSMTTSSMLNYYIWYPTINQATLRRDIDGGYVLLTCSNGQGIYQPDSQFMVRAFQKLLTAPNETIPVHKTKKVLQIPKANERFIVQHQKGHLVELVQLWSDLSQKQLPRILGTAEDLAWPPTFKHDSAPTL